jgi:hypothetical protein
LILSKNLTPRNKVTKKDLQKDIRQMNEDFAEMIKQLAGQQQAHAIALQQLSGLCFALAQFMDGTISACTKCQKYVVVDAGVKTCPSCDSELQLGPVAEAPDGTQEDGNPEG